MAGVQPSTQFYLTTADGNSQLVTIESVDSPSTAERLVVLLQDMTCKFAEMDAQLGLLQLQLAALEASLAELQHLRAPMQSADCEGK